LFKTTRPWGGKPKPGRSQGSGPNRSQSSGINSGTSKLPRS